MAHRARAGYLTRSWHMVRVIICVCVAQCHGKAQDGRRGAVTLPNSLWGYFLVHPEVVGVYISICLVTGVLSTVGYIS